MSPSAAHIIADHYRFCVVRIADSALYIKHSCEDVSSPTRTQTTGWD